MILREIGLEEKDVYNRFVAEHGHVAQSWEWGEFRSSIGTEVLRFGVFDGSNLLATLQLTLHPVPRTDKTVGYVAKGPVIPANPDVVFPALIDGIKSLAPKYNLIFVKLEPAILETPQWLKLLQDQGLKKSRDVLYAEWNFLLDLKPTEAEILAKMHPKWRYNIRLAERKGVQVVEGTANELQHFLNLQHQTMKRQGFIQHPDDYYLKWFEFFSQRGMAKLLLSQYQGQVLAAWLLLQFGTTLYYPFGASSDSDRNVMPVHLMVWRAIQIGKHLGLQTFDLWGADNPDPKARHRFWGTHQFKLGFGPELVHYLGTYDLPLNRRWYRMFTLGYGPFIKVYVWLKNLAG